MRSPIDLIIDSTHDGIIAVDREGRVTLLNRPAERMTGLSAQQVIGRPVAEVLPGVQRAVSSVGRAADS